MTKPVIISERFCTDNFMVERDKTNVNIWYYVGDIPTGIGLEVTLKYNSVHAAKTIYGRCKNDKEFTHKMYFDFIAEEMDEDDSVCI